MQSRPACQLRHATIAVLPSTGRREAPPAALDHGRCREMLMYRARQQDGGAGGGLSTVLEAT